MKKLLALLLALTMVLSLAACGSKEATAPDSKPDSGTAAEPAAEKETAEPIVLELWLQGNNVGDPSLSEDQWWITQAIQAFEDANPNITVELTVPSGQVEITQTYKAACVAGTAPDIVNLWSGTNLFPLSELVLDPTEYLRRGLRADHHMERVLRELRHLRKAPGHPLRGAGQKRLYVLL